MATIAEVAAHDYEDAAGKHRLAHERAMRQVERYERASALAQDRKRDATAELMAERAHGFNVEAKAHLAAAVILSLASRSETRA